MMYTNPGDFDPLFGKAQSDYRMEQLRHGHPTGLLGMLTWGLIKGIVLLVRLPVSWGLRMARRRR